MAVNKGDDAQARNRPPTWIWICLAGLFIFAVIFMPGNHSREPSLVQLPLPGTSGASSNR